jgi:hypothetical protein
MTSPKTIINHLDWASIAAQMDIEGYALLPGLLGADVARALARQTDTPITAQRVPLTSTDLGSGELLYLGSDLPAPWETWRTAFYHHLAPIANRWNDILNISERYPAELEDFLRRNQKIGQRRPQSHLNRLGVEDYIPLHQRSDGEQMFPMQIVALLSDPGNDFHGGEFVMTEQRPRMQSRPMVLPLKLGDAAVITTSERPFKGTRGHYRVNLKHAISRVRQGKRIGVELTFHDAR